VLEGGNRIEKQQEREDKAPGENQNLKTKKSEKPEKRARKPMSFLKKIQDFFENDQEQ
jgi:hypothetical protein